MPPLRRQSQARREKAAPPTVLEDAVNVLVLVVASVVGGAGASYAFNACSPARPAPTWVDNVRTAEDPRPPLPDRGADFRPTSAPAGGASFAAVRGGEPALGAAGR